jgi:anaphase-promoting complex subunit 8
MRFLSRQMVKKRLMTPSSSANTPHQSLRQTKMLSRYLLAKSLFDCKEYDRCAAVFLPDSLLSTVLDSRLEKPLATPKGKGKSRATNEPSLSAVPLPKLSQKSLFLALYAKFISGEKRKNEESEMVMGPQDLGTVVNKQLLIVGRFLAAWFEERTTDDDEVLGSQGWLEYLYVANMFILLRHWTISGIC